MRKDYHTTLATYFQSKPLYLDGENSKKPNVRKLVEQPWQELEAAKGCEKHFEKNSGIKEEREKLWDNVTNTLCNLDFIQAKVAAKLTYDLVNEINNALIVIPDNAKEIAKEKARQAHMDKYTLDLIAFANGELTIDELEIPESITPWTEDQINSEIERIKTNLNRADKLKDFRNFILREYRNIEDYYSHIKNFITQQAWNYSNAGPVFIASENRSSDIYKNLLLLYPKTLPAWNPFHPMRGFITELQNKINSIEISTDGQQAYIIFSNRACLKWDLLSGQNKRILNEYTILSISPDGKHAFAKKDDKTYVLLNISTEKEMKIFTKSLKKKDCILGNWLLKRYKNLTDYIFKSQYPPFILPGGQKMLTRHNSSLCVWNLLTGSLIKVIPFDNSCSISQSGKLIVRLEERTKFGLIGFFLGFNQHKKSWILYDLNTDEITKYSFKYDCLDKHLRNKILSHSILCDKILTLKESKLYNLTKVKNDQGINISSDDFGYVGAHSITHDGKIAIVAHFEDIIIWDLTRGLPIANLKAIGNGVNCVSISPDGRYAITSEKDTNVNLWDLSVINSKQIRHEYDFVRYQELRKNVQHGSMLLIKGYPDNENKACISWYIPLAKADKYRQYDRYIEPIDGNKDWIWTIVLNLSNSIAKGDLISINVINSLFDISLGKMFLKAGQESFTNWLFAVSFTPDGKRAVSRLGVDIRVPSANSPYIILWDIKSGEIIHSISYYAKVVSITQDGQYALIGCSDTFMLMNLIQGKIRYSFEGIDINSLNQFCLTPDGRVLIIEQIFWDIKLRKTIKKLENSKIILSRIHVSPCGKWVICHGGDGEYKIWNIRTDFIKTLNIVGHSLLFTPDGRRAFTLDHKKCYLWDFDAGKKLAVFISNSYLNRIAIIPGGILLGCNNGEIAILEYRKGRFYDGISILTIRKSWDFEFNKFQDHNADCLNCGSRFVPPQEVITTIDEITKEAGLTPDQSPCLELPDEAWEHPGLISECPKCKEKIKFNPFIAGGEEY